MSNHVQFNLISVRSLCSLLREDLDFKANESLRDIILNKMENMEKPIAISKPRFSSHMLVAMPYRSKSFFIIQFQGSDVIDFFVKDFPDIISDQINVLVNYQICQYDHYVFLAGGTSYNSESESFPSDRGFIYNILTDKWSSGPSVPNSGYGFGLSALDNKLYYVPNDDGPGKITSMEMYGLEQPDPCSGTWVTIAQMNYRRAQVQMVVLDGFLYGLGGMENGGYTSIVEKYDPIEQFWTEVDSMSQGRYVLNQFQHMTSCKHLFIISGVHLELPSAMANSLSLEVLGIT